MALDLVIARQPFFDEAKFVLDLAKKDVIKLAVSSGSIVTMIYVTYERYKLPNAGPALLDVLSVCSVVSTSKLNVFSAINSDFSDKEDAFQYYTALGYHADYFLTRDRKGFKTAKPDELLILSPAQFEYSMP